MAAKHLAENRAEVISPELSLFGELRQPVIDPDADFNLTTEYGNTLEIVMGKYLSTRLGVPVYRVPLMLQHPHYPFLFANLDFVAVFPDPETGELCNVVNVQCKTATHWKLDEIKEQIPIAHEIQCRQEMCVANLDESIIIYLCDNNEGGIVSYRVPRDYSLEAGLIQKAKAFQWHVDNEILPFPSVATDAAMRDIALYATARKQSYRPPEILERGMPELVAQYVRWKEQVDKTKEDYEQAKSKLAEAALRLTPFLLDRPEAVCGDVKMKWKQRTTRPVDLDGLKLAYPDIYARFVTETVHTSFDVGLRKPAQQQKKEKEAA
jgi:predicted phage-related endonuclease